ncbi:MAG: 4Fe-4S ferredoxin [Clostridiales bacterium]|nr:4Fe-4S ferredoxin [Clostridiales bacterium]
MNKILIYYFSGTGNTKKIADEYKSALEARECDVTLRALSYCEKPETTDANEFDRIGIGYPIHGFNAPKIILDLCKALPKRDRKKPFKPVFIFKTSGEPVRMSDVSSLKTIKLLNRRGYAVINEYQYVMPYNIIFRHTDEQAYKMWQTAQPLVRADVNEILRETPHLPKKMFMGGFLAWIIRAEHWGAKIIGRGFKANKNCVNCGLCVKNCPAANIKIKKNGKLKFGGQCMICMRCVFKCPKDGINAGLLKGWKVNGDYSFERPAEPSPPSKHDNYCKKAYDKYYADAQARIEKYNEENQA